MLDSTGRPRIVQRSAGRGWAQLEKQLEPVMHPYRLAEQRCHRLVHRRQNASLRRREHDDRRHRRRHQRGRRAALSR